MYTPERLSVFFQQCPATAYLIAFSGGLDSHVLLHSAAQLRAVHPHLNLRAVHVDHGLQTPSVGWARHCRQVCEKLAVPFACEHLKLKPVLGESVEAAARTARYAAFTRHLRSGEMLLTAHHRNDQAETLLLHLVRGSGVDGLAAMPEVRTFALGRLGRPLLAFTRQDLQAYADLHQLDYVEDPSNQDVRFDRNYLRRRVMPVLEERWPSVADTLARAARLQRESRELLHGFLGARLPELQGSRTGTLSVSRLLAQDVVLRKALLREWLAQQGFERPEEQKLLHVISDLLHAREDAEPCVKWHGCEIRRYRDDVYALKPLPPHDVTKVLVWGDISQPLRVPSLDLTLQPEVLGEWQEYLQANPASVTVRFRQGGESVCIPYRGGHHSLKNLLQEAAIPPWERLRLPLVYVGEWLVYMPGVLSLQPRHVASKH
ncbi:MAG: tRNA lysidine(34) synthetase TilS [Gammaproteobacteria bacterium]|nr:tRNA lysidine(34) synthetase TilS [Gammaproteobacteria bacterium]MBU1722450.1 tRNA lysidine(34) synthetase TilS [Gammaproteobacteria bacterium]MBU2004949.1 tRNA lysidine(34) synthetase TilS [Gammaproteobacteria bacterium]